MSFEAFIARRYLTARRRQAFIGLISAVSIAGVAVGVMAVIIALALMTGVQGEMRDKIVGSEAHVYVYKTARFDAFEAEAAAMRIPGVIGAAPAAVGFGLLRAATDQPVEIKGIDPRYEPEVTDLARAMMSGRVEALLDRPPRSLDGVILGVDLAAALGVTVGDRVLLITTTEVATPGGAVPRRRPLEVVGVAAFGFYKTDSMRAFVALAVAEQVLGLDGPSYIQLRVAHVEEAPAVRAALQERLGLTYAVDDWTEVNRSLYSALWLEKIAISLTIGLVVMVAALNIVASLVLLVMEKSRDIAILRTMGASARAIRRIFVYQGLAVGLVGTAAGTALGVAVCLVADRYKLLRLDADVYQITWVPFRVLPFDVAVVVLAAVGICLAATIYPARQAGRLDPAEALRHQ
jgi:lipoprotein-releasing system permease protein